MSQNNKKVAHRGWKIREGCPALPGATMQREGCVFTLEAPENASVSLVLYPKQGGEAQVLPFKESMRTGRMWSMLVERLDPRAWDYNFLVNDRVEQDKRAKGFLGGARFGERESSDPHHLRCTFGDQKKYSWGEEKTPQLLLEDLILYKLHVRGFTMKAPRSVRHKGTFAGLREAIPYLKELGINAVELMPCYEFRERGSVVPSGVLVTKRRSDDRVNFWGYTEGCYFAPKAAYCGTAFPQQEVRDLVKALHAAGMLCIMEFYFPEEENAKEALEALEFWKLFYHVDGFHIQGGSAIKEMAIGDGLLFDSLLFFTDSDGVFYPPQRGRRIALYQSAYWQDIRRFLKSDEDMVGRVLGDLRANAFDHGLINYLTSQDGFTLEDAVSYNYRHNEANGEGNHDGCSYNFSWNCGEEGQTRKASVKRLRQKQKRNAMLMLLLSQGIPMLYAGDEFGNSQGGNNNAWCQDNETGWVDWSAARKNRGFQRFVKELITFRKAHRMLHRNRELRGTDYLAQGFPDLSSHGETAWMVNQENTSRLFALLYNEGYAKDISRAQKSTPEDYLYLAFNFHWEERRFALPNLPDGWGWERISDSDDASGSLLLSEPTFHEHDVTVSPRSIVILCGAKKKENQPYNEQHEEQRKDE